MSAPGRGRWERHLSRDTRRALQRRRILAALPRVVAVYGNAFTVDEIVEAAGVGRNTFYVHFTDVEAAMTALVVEMRDSLANALLRAERMARTPNERLRAVAAAWARTAAEHPSLAVLAHAEVEGGGVNATLRHALESAVSGARRVVAVSREAETLRLDMVVGAFDAAAAHVAMTPSSEDSVRDMLAELVVRFVR